MICLNTITTFRYKKMYRHVIIVEKLRFHKQDFIYNFCTHCVNVCQPDTFHTLITWTTEIDS